MAGQHRSPPDAMAIILAAGRGSRLSAVLSDKPKVLLEVNGEAILARQVRFLLRKGISRICVILGYKSEDVIRCLEQNGLAHSPVAFIRNHDFDNSDNSYSVGLGLKMIDDHESVIILDGDLVYDEILLDTLVDSPTPACIVDDVRIASSEDARVLVDNGYVTAIGKWLNSGPIYTSMIKVSGPLLEALRAEIDRPRVSREWYSEPLTRALSFNKQTLVPLPKGAARHCEIDTPEDWRMANRLFGSQL